MKVILRVHDEGYFKSTWWRLCALNLISAFLFHIINLEQTFIITTQFANTGELYSNIQKCLHNYSEIKKGFRRNWSVGIINTWSQKSVRIINHSPFKLTNIWKAIFSIDCFWRLFKRAKILLKELTNPKSRLTQCLQHESWSIDFGD